jgi:hypothetical protein
MKTRFLIIPVITLASVACDRAKDFAERMTKSVKQEIAEKAGATSDESTQADPELEKLVDQTDEGVLFRKDLPFPEKLEVQTTLRNEISGRFSHSSAIESEAGAMNGTQISILKLERSGDQVRYTLEQSSFAPTLPKVAPGKKPDLKQTLNDVAPAAKPVVFRKTGGKWQAEEGSGFHAASLSQDLAPVFDEVLIENALSPRPLWLSKRRVKIGETINLSGDYLAMVLSGETKGSLSMKLDAIGASNGHPCGIFSVTGDYNRQRLPDFEGNVVKESVTIQSGKLWLSLLHPVILKEELDTIQTIQSGNQGNKALRGQGSIKVSIDRDWKPLTPDR